MPRDELPERFRPDPVIDERAKYRRDLLRVLGPRPRFMSPYHWRQEQERIRRRALIVHTGKPHLYFSRGQWRTVGFGAGVAGSLAFLRSQRWAQGRNQNL